MTTVRVITVHHRGKAMLERCVRSLLDSHGVELDVVVVANGCAEELPDVVGSSSRVRVVECPKPVGFAAANNFGVDWAGTRLGEPDFYYFANNDTESPPASLAGLVAAVEEDPKIAVAGPRVLILDAPEYLNSLGLNVTHDGWGWDEGIGIRQQDYGPLRPRRPVLAVTGAALLITAEALHRVRGWSELYGYYFEDIDLCLKVRQAGWDVVNVPEVAILHQISATMTDGSERKQLFFWRNRLVLAWMHWPPRLILTALRCALDEIRANPWGHTRLQRRALASALGRLPQALFLRLRRPRGRQVCDWTQFLHPPGSVPVIHLPAAAAHDDPAAEAAPKSSAAQDEGPPRIPELEALVESLTVRLRQTEAELESIRRSKMWRLWMGYHRWRRALLRPFT